DASATVSSSASLPRAQTITEAPSSARPIATARPIPLLPPVTIATLPSSPKSIGFVSKWQGRIAARSRSRCALTSWRLSDTIVGLFDLFTNERSDRFNPWRCNRAGSRFGQACFDESVYRCGSSARRDAWRRGVEHRTRNRKGGAQVAARNRRDHQGGDRAAAASERGLGRRSRIHQFQDGARVLAFRNASRRERGQGVLETDRMGD